LGSLPSIGAFTFHKHLTRGTCEGHCAAIIPAHEAQLKTYLRMSGIPIGFIFNFNTARLTDGLRRFVV
jgi:hypothetical protein